MRQTYPALLSGKTEVEEKDEKTNKEIPSLLSFTRRTEEEKYRILINFHSLEAVDYSLDEEETPLVLLLADETKKATLLDKTLTIPPYSMALIRVQ